MGSVIGDLLPLAAGVALSPIPIIAVVLMLGTPRASSNGPAFAVAWVIGLSVVAAVVLLVSSGADSSESTSDGIDVVTLLIGVAFLVMAARQWRNRPAPGTVPEPPSWMATIDSFTARRSFVLGIVLSALNPKNLALTVAAAASIGQAGLDAGDDVVAIVVFVAIASVTVVGAVVYHAVGGETAARALDNVKQFMAAHNAVIMMVILLLLGLKMVGSGLAITD